MLLLPSFFLALLLLLPASPIWSQSSAEEEAQAAQLEAAIELLLEAEYEEALRKFEKLHAEGYAEGSYLLGHFYLLPSHGRTDWRKAERIFQDLYAAGFTKAAAGILAAWGHDAERQRAAFDPANIDETLALAEAAASTELALHHPEIFGLAGVVNKIKAGGRVTDRALAYFKKAAGLGSLLGLNALARHCQELGGIEGYEDCRELYEIAARNGAPEGLGQLAKAKLQALFEFEGDSEQEDELFARAIGLLYVSRLFGSDIGKEVYNAFYDKYGGSFSQLAQESGEHWLKRNVESPSGGLYGLYRFCDTHDFGVFFGKRVRRDCRDYIIADHDVCNFGAFLEDRDFMASKLYRLCRFSRLGPRR